MRSTDAVRSLIFAGFLLGVGLGGLLESILFRQLLQLHGMLSAQPASGAESLFWNGMAQLFAWTSAALGVYCLWTVARHAPEATLSGRILLGSVLLGTGVALATECILHHYLFGLHHLVQRLGPSLFDSLDLGLALALVGLGVVAIREGLSVRQRLLTRGGSA